MQVFTYYEPLVGKDTEVEIALIELWKASWRSRGWFPCVLTSKDLPKDASSQKLLKAFRRQPSLNRPGLDYSCFARWLAVASQGGGYMCDYDVINYAFVPRAVGELTVYERHVPCLVSGTADEFLRMCQVFANYRPDLKDRVGWRFDVSDMKILARRNDTYVARQDCVEYSHDGWERAEAVHFSNFSMKPRGYVPRYRHIPDLRPLPLKEQPKVVAEPV